MRKSRGTLKREAKESAAARGHVIGYWINNGYYRAEAECLKCGMHVFVDVNPPPNGIDIHGEAIALNCK